jgi:pyruvate/2-oxoglutarate dehydrogenase complex dihydrolipoamide acyltransferase (E2) component
VATIEVKVPDIGNYSGVPVIEVLVKPGDAVAKDQGLVTLESDKATMEVPSSVAGVVKEVRVKLNDEVSEGDIVAVVKVADAGASSKPASQASSSPRPLAGEAAAQSAAGEGSALQRRRTTTTLSLPKIRSAQTRRMMTPPRP